MPSSKHCTLTPQQRVRLVRYVIDRFHTGDFAQQFKDLLRLALFLDSPSLLEVEQESLTDKRDYVRRYAKWILAHEPKHPNA